jgi:glycine betaine catabolism A
VSRWPQPIEGSWTQHYPELETESVSYDDSISPEFYELEKYHAPVLHAEQSPAPFSTQARENGDQASHDRIDGPHRLVSSAGIRAWEMDREMYKRMEEITRKGLFGPWDVPDLGVERMPVSLNPGRSNSWGNDSFHVFATFVFLIWSQGWYLTSHYWPTCHTTHIFEGALYFVPAKTARERLAHEITTFSFQGVPAPRRQHARGDPDHPRIPCRQHFAVGDPEVLCHLLHKVSAHWVEEYKKKAGVSARSISRFGFYE